ncbi:alpha/beta hydrolase-fold protein [Actinoplanes sp. Pm04-4]|uniref:Alpha/beta hydrolase-fold protein n=1 Tax=Paractinoplanes pyxinae TaxID=2997416 RepID=A0ABT4ASS7_9ACTN|nr:alpha/beta hydrolase-fold protein [Actinoplanes pyxinae]MCY1137284.1 alpha/beta hydrolase-fold protein [Actinoplanes pyxinae]
MPKMALLACSVLLLAPAAPASAATPSCATTGSVDFGIDLAGSGWKFTTGDDPSWSDPSFVDSGWRDWSVPDNWGAVSDLSSYDGYAWYRKTFTLPARPEGVTDSAVVAALGKIDDADQTFLNGTEIGHTGGFPPAFDSTWEVPREYYPADGLLRWGATNVIAVRAYDGTGGGGFHQGPVGLFSKARLRALAGISGTPASRTQLAHVCAVLGKQHRAVAAGDRRAYASTLADGFFHQGDTAARRLASLPGSVSDGQAEVFVDSQGRLVVDTIRQWGDLAPARELLSIDPRRKLELGDHSRFFRDEYESAAMKRRVQFNVYLPKSYTRTQAKRYPVVYMLNGFNGSNIEWESRKIDAVLDNLALDAIVVFPDGDSGWYVDTSAGNFRTMIVDGIVPLVDRFYRTIPDRDHRGVSGVSMGGQGAFTLGLKNPEVFSSIASHMGALSLAPLVGTAEEQAANAGLRPLTLVAAMSAADLSRHRFYFDGGDQDDYRFGAAAQQMSTLLASKGVKHDYQLGPGRHDDAYWMPKLDRSFALHTEQFNAHPYRQPKEPKPIKSPYVWP